ncbi:MAG: flagellar hook-associated protein FlgK [Thermodesulfobacteriota bacterium]|nr:flagellar hook-associated protein FlgK [Thermodesulfobacteriota bacterium]
MAGISHVLNIAKNALLTHQVSLQVAGHNVANVDTPGYNRQELTLNSALSTPMSYGNIGGGVAAVTIGQKYDKFMTARIMNQNSTLGNLKAQQDSLRVVETIFNETRGLALNDLMSQFWDSWQNLSDNPELSSSRQITIQKAQLLSTYFENLNAEITQGKYDIGISLDTSINDINSMTEQIAELNVDITSTESNLHSANDLRDKRDQILKDVSKLIDIVYFETNTGAYTILLNDGHALVEGCEHWDLSMKNNVLYWHSVTSDGQTFEKELGSGAELGGKIGGLLEVRGNLLENNPDNYLGRLDALANAFVREVNQQHSQGVGLVTFSKTTTSSAQAYDAARLTGTVDATLATTEIPADTLIINNRKVGEIKGGSTSNGLAMTKAHNAVTAINAAVTGVDAKLTTLVAGSAITAAAAGDDGNIISFSINNVSISYTVDSVAPPALNDSDQATFATHLVSAINTAINNYNTDATNPTDVTITAVVGDTTNGGAANSIVLKNTNAGDESNIIIAEINLADQIGLTDGTFNADKTHNTGEVTLFSDQEFTVEAGSDDRYLSHFGWGGGGIGASDTANDGKFTYNYDDGGVASAMQGYKYADELVTDGAGFDIWLYNDDGTLALPNVVTVSIDRAYTLQDVADSINTSLTNAGAAGSWLMANVSNNQLVFTPDTTHEFAFANDTSNFLQVAELNTFFTGHSSGTINVNSILENDLDRIAAGQVNANGLIFNGDNSNALLMTNIQRDENITFTGGSIDTLDGFYNTLIAEIGLTAKTVNQDYEFNNLVITEMNKMRDSVSGVSLDEEMANLIKYQHAYASAAKLISMADEMMETLLNVIR